RSAFERALNTAESPRALEGLGRARWWLADSSGAIASFEQAYTAYRRAGDDARAARMALLLAEEYAEARGNGAAANGWLARARDLLGESSSSAERGWLRLAEARAAFGPTESRELAVEALDLGRRFA